MCDCLWTGKPSQYITNHSAFYSSQVSKIEHQPTLLGLTFNMCDVASFIFFNLWQKTEEKTMQNA